MSATSTSHIRAISTEARRHSHSNASPRAVRASASSRSSPDAVRDELDQCFALVERLGRGVVYLGSARVKESHSHYVHARSLSKEIAHTLDCTTWSGGGAGMMDAATRGALDANKPVGGIMIDLEAGQRKGTKPSRTHPYLPAESYLCARFFSARKHGLVDAATRATKRDRTAFVALPGGVGTLDEIFEILALVQLKRLDTAHEVPFLFMNYDGCYAGLLDFLKRDLASYGAVTTEELEDLFVACDTNEDALAYLKKFYNL